MTKEKYRELISTLLECGINDVDIITDIDADIVSEARKSLEVEEINIFFPSLYRECAEIALAQEEIEGEIDSNYGCSSIFIAKRFYKKAETLEKLGFSIGVSE